MSSLQNPLHLRSYYHHGTRSWRGPYAVTAFGAHLKAFLHYAWQLSGRLSTTRPAPRTLLLWSQPSKCSNSSAPRRRAKLGRSDASLGYGSK